MRCGEMIFPVEGNIPAGRSPRKIRGGGRGARPTARNLSLWLTLESDSLPLRRRPNRRVHDALDFPRFAEIRERGRAVLDSCDELSHFNGLQVIETKLVPAGHCEIFVGRVSRACFDTGESRCPRLAPGLEILKLIEALL